MHIVRSCFVKRLFPIGPLMTIFVVSGVSCVADAVPEASRVEQSGVKGSRNEAHFLGYKLFFFIIYFTY